jgi:TatD DNase family protein
VSLNLFLFLVARSKAHALIDRTVDIMREIIDTHTHLYDLEDPKSVLHDALLAGVSDVVALGVDMRSNRMHVSLQADLRRVALPPGEGLSFPRVHLALGLHPGNVTPQEARDCFPFFRDILRSCVSQGAGGSGVVAIGETGLDFWYNTVRKDPARRREQMDVFEAHLALAGEFDLPVVVHSRGAWRECLDMAISSGVDRVDFHWYSGPLDVLKDILDRGYVISVSPALEYSPQARRAAEYAPLEQILLETDTPVRVAAPQGGRVSSTPRDVWRTFRALCAVKGLDEERALPALNRSAAGFFALVP